MRKIKFYNVENSVTRNTCIKELKSVAFIFIIKLLLFSEMINLFYKWQLIFIFRLMFKKYFFS